MRTGAEKKLRSPDQTLYSGQSLSELCDRLNPGECSPVLGPDRQPRAANEKINIKHAPEKGKKKEILIDYFHLLKWVCSLPCVDAPVPTQFLHCTRLLPVP